MKAIACTKYGPPGVLKIVEVPKPTPKENEVLIKVFATAVTASDTYIRNSNLPLRFRIPMRIALGLTKPRKSIIGLVLSGEIESVGTRVNRFKPGDLVYGLTGFGMGAYAEYKCMRVVDSPSHGCLALKPSHLTHAEATVAAYGGLLALQSLEQGQIEKRKRVLVYGASGTSGTLAVQIAKHLGAHVTGVCSTANLKLVQSLGADLTLDYTQEKVLPPGSIYDLIVDTAGKAKTSPLKKTLKKALVPQGQYVSIDDGVLKLDSKRLDRIRNITEAGKVRPWIDRTYTLDQIVEAHAYVDQGHKKGGVPIIVKPE